MCPEISQHVSKNNRLFLNPNLQSLANVLERICFVAPDGTDLKKTVKWSNSWIAFDRVSLKMFVSLEIVRFNSLSPTTPFAMLMMLPSIAGQSYLKNFDNDRRLLP